MERVSTRQAWQAGSTVLFCLTLRLGVESDQAKVNLKGDPTWDVTYSHRDLYENRKMQLQARSRDELPFRSVD